MKIKILLLFALLAQICFGQQSKFITKQKVDSIISIHGRSKDFSGIIGFWQKDRGAQMFSYGYKNFETKALITNTDRFYLASLSKQFTGLGIAQLISEGKLSSHDTIGKWFPQLSHAFRNVTVAQLANHTAAIHDYFSLTLNHEGITNDSVVRLIQPIDSTVFPSGTKWGYSNTTYVLLAIIIEKITKQPFTNWCKENIFKPTKMSNADFVYNGAKAIQGYDIDSTPLTIKTKTYGDGGMLGSANDITAFFKATGENPKWKKLLQISLENGYLYDRDTAWISGFSWFFTKNNFGKFAAGSGKGAGFLNYYRWYYEKDAAFFILSNKWNPYIRNMREDLATLLHLKN